MQQKNKRCVKLHTVVRVRNQTQQISLQKGVNAVNSHLLHVYLPTEKAFQSLFAFHQQYTFVSQEN